MASSRKPLVILGGVVVAVVLLLLVVPLLFGGRLSELAKAKANEALDASVDWTDASLSLLGDFPNLTLGLEGLAVVNRAPFAGDTLAAADELRLTIDLMSAIRAAMGGTEPVLIRAVELEEPRLRLRVLEDGRANWQITKPSADATSGGGMAIRLKRFVIEDGMISYDDRAGKLEATLVGLDQTLRGDFAQTNVDVGTAIRADSATVTFAGIRYLDHVRLALDADVAVDTKARRYELRDGTRLRLNDLQLDAAGRIAQQGEQTTLDVAVRAPSTELKSLLSLVPAIWARDFAAVKTSGSLAVQGEVKGTYGPRAFPAFRLDATVTDGAFRYPDLPLGASGIALDLGLRNPGGDADSTVVELRRFRAQIGDAPVEARLVVRTPISDPDVDARVQGRVNLADLKRTVKLPDVQELEGTVSADAAVRARLSAVDQGRYDRVSASGTVTLVGVRVEGGLPRPLAVQDAELRLAPQRAELSRFSGTIGRSDVRATGQLDNLLGWVLRDDVLRGRADVTSRRFVLDEWKSDTSATGIIPVPDRLDLALSARVDTLLLEKLRMTDARGTVRVKDRRVTIDGFDLRMLGGTVAMRGFYETTNPAVPTFDFTMNAKELDVPSAFGALTTVQAIAPMAKYMQGRVTSEFRLTGPLGENLMPVLKQLSGSGSLTTTQLAITDFPPFAKAAQATKLALLNNPTLRAIATQFEVTDGRFRLKPFTVGIGGTTMTVSGSNGFDQTLDYDLKVQLPRELVGGANDAMQSLVQKAASRGVNLGAAPSAVLGITMRGSVTNPTIGTDLGASAASAVQDAGKAFAGAAEQKATAAVDSAKLRLDAERAKAVAAAETQAAKIRAEAQALADRITQESNAQADSLVAKAGSNPLRRVAAEAAAKKLRQEGAARATGVVRDADAKAAELVRAAGGQP